MMIVNLFFFASFLSSRKRTAASEIATTFFIQKESVLVKTQVSYHSELERETQKVAESAFRERRKILMCCETSSKVKHIKSILKEKHKQRSQMTTEMKCDLFVCSKKLKLTEI